MKVKKIIMIASILAGLILLVALRGYVSNPERKIKSFVEQNEEELARIAEDYLDSGEHVKAFQGIEVDGLFKGTHPMVQFFYSGKGIAPAGKYYGFYYSPDDVPLSYQNAENVLTQVSDTEWEWKDNGDNGGRTVKIMEKWFYYEAWF